MNNEQLNMFSMNPVGIGRVQRSRMSRPKRHLTTFDAGKLIPVYCEEVLPGDTVSMDVKSLVRMTTPKYPTMDNLYMDVHFFFSPNRILWDHWKEFMGENTTGPWRQTVNYTVPKLSVPTSGGDNVSGSNVAGFAVGTVGDYLGVPIKVGNLNVNALPFRAYALIWNNYYRDENIMYPVNIYTGDNTSAGSNSGIYSASDYATFVTNNIPSNGFRGCAPLPVCKFHDVFTSALPEPRKGPTLTLPLGTTAPVLTYPSITQDINTTGLAPVRWHNTSNVLVGQLTGNSSSANFGGSNSNGAIPSNLYTDLANATASTLDEIRNIFMLAHYYEALARGGSRYFESIKALFNVNVPDATVQIPEFLGGVRVPINIIQVAQTSATDLAVGSGGSQTPLGNLAAFSQTADDSSIFTKSFTEHGYLMGFVCVRAEHSYQQGIPKHLTKSTLFDYYFPQFANASEQPIYNKEIYATGTSIDDQVFGYQEAWYEYRYSPNQISGEFRSEYSASLDPWHYGDDYSSLPTLSIGWIRESQDNIQRTLAVSNVAQFLGDFQFDATWVREMPLYSVPGLDRL